jgi:hypothetical protein
VVGQAMILRCARGVNARAKIDRASYGAFEPPLGSWLHEVIAMQHTSRSGRVERLQAPNSRYIVGCLTIALVMLSGPTGCSTSNRTPSASTFPEPATPAEILANAPTWVTEGCRSHWEDTESRRKVVCGIGSATSHRNRIAARDTAVARARSAIARSIQVTIENLVRLEDTGTRSEDGEMRSIVHQLTSASLPGCQVEAVWEAETGEVHALVSLQVAKVQRSVRNTRAFSPAAREDLAHRAALAFAAMDATFEAGADETGPVKNGNK